MRLEVITEEDVLRPFEKMISTYNKSQRATWVRWASFLPERVAKVMYEHLKATENLKFWVNVNYLLIILSAAVPIIVTVLIQTLNVPSMASLLDAVFPAIVVVMQRIMHGWSSRRHTYAQHVSPYRTMLSNVVVDIYEEKYTDDKHQFYLTKWQELDEIIREWL